MKEMKDGIFRSCTDSLYTWC